MVPEHSCIKYHWLSYRPTEHTQGRTQNNSEESSGANASRQIVYSGATSRALLSAMRIGITMQAVEFGDRAQINSRPRVSKLGSEIFREFVYPLNHDFDQDLGRLILIPADLALFCYGSNDSAGSSGVAALLFTNRCLSTLIVWSRPWPWVFLRTR
jgi:hypothetical protein